MSHAAQTLSADAPPPRFESLRLHRAGNLPFTPAPAVAAALLAARADAAAAEDGHAMVFAGIRQGVTVLLVPWRSQPTTLPVRLGEKRLWQLSLAAIRLTPAAQHGIATLADARELLRWLRLAHPSRAVALTDAEVDGPLYQAALDPATLGYCLLRDQPDKHLLHRFGASYQAFFDARGSKYRNQLRKKEKDFVARFGSDHELREYRQPHEVKDFLDAASAINRRTYQFRLFGETVDADARSLAAGQREAEAGMFRSFVLWHGHQALCFVLGHQGPSGVYEHRQTGYDPDWRDFAPGIFCNMLLLQRLYAIDKPEYLDFGSGDSDYKRLFSNESRVTASPLLVPRRPRYLPGVWLHRGAEAGNALAVRLLSRWGVKDWIKRRLRRAA